MDTDTFIQFKILHRLNEVRKNKGLYSRTNLKDLSTEMSIDHNKFMARYANELFTLGQIDMNTGDEAYITPKGVAMIETNNPLFQEFRQAENKTININAPVVGSAIIQGNNNNTTVTLNFLDKFEKEIENSSLTPEEKKTWIGRLKDIGSHPILSSLCSKALEGGLKSLSGGGA